MTKVKLIQPPLAKQIPTYRELHGVRLNDDYAWLREKNTPAVLQYLKDENKYTERIMESTTESKTELQIECQTKSLTCFQTEFPTELPTELLTEIPTEFLTESSARFLTLMYLYSNSMSIFDIFLVHQYPI